MLAGGLNLLKAVIHFLLVSSYTQDCKDSIWLGVLCQVSESRVCREFALCKQACSRLNRQLKCIIALQLQKK